MPCIDAEYREACSEGESAAVCLDLALHPTDVGSLRCAAAALSPPDRPSSTKKGSTVDASLCALCQGSGSIVELYNHRRLEVRTLLLAQRHLYARAHMRAVPTHVHCLLRPVHSHAPPPHAWPLPTHSPTQRCCEGCSGRGVIVSRGGVELPECAVGACSGDTGSSSR